MASYVRSHTAILLLLGLCLQSTIAATLTSSAPLDTCSQPPLRRAVRCLSKQSPGFQSSYCSDVLKISTSTTTVTEASTSTVTVPEVITTSTVTSTADPITISITAHLRLNETSTSTDVVTHIINTYTSFDATTTVDSTSTYYVYTCGPTASPSPALASVTASASSNSMPLSTGMAGSSSSAMPSSPPPYGNYSSSASTSSVPSGTGAWSNHAQDVELLELRASPLPTCVRRQLRLYGVRGAQDACSCLGIATPTPVTTTVTTLDPSHTATITSTFKVVGITTTTPTVTATETKTRTKAYTTTEVITTSAATTTFDTLTRTHIVPTTIFTTSAVPTLFNIYYYNTSANDPSPQARYFQAETAPSKSGIVLAAEGAADNFMLDGQGRLVDKSYGGSFVGKVSTDVYPFEYLQTTVAPDNVAFCTGCNGVLSCDYSGTTGNVFAICGGFLALGQPDVFRQSPDGASDIDCSPIALQYK